MKRFLAVAACIAIVGNTGTLALAETVVINSLNGIANGETGTLKTGVIGDTHVWQDGAADSVVANLVTGGSLTVSNYSSDIVNGVLDATGGTLRVTNGTLTLNSNSSIADAVTTNLSSSSTLAITGGSAVFSNLDTLSGDINISSGTLSLDSITTRPGILTQTGGTTSITGGTFNLNNNNDSITGGSLILETGSTLSATNGTIKDTKVTIDTGSTLNVDGGNATLDSSSTYEGNVNLTAGSLALVGIQKNTSGVFNQTGGNTDITGDFTFNNSSDSISGGTVNIGTADTEGYLTVNKGSIGTGATVNIDKEGVLEVAGGSVTLDSGDNWSGILGVTQGSITLDNVTKNQGGVFVLENGTTTITGSNFAMNNSLDEVTGGTLNIGNSTTAGTLGVKNSTIGSNATVNLASNSNINFNSGEINMDATDTWAGTIDMTGGTLNIHNNQKTGSLTQIDGTVNITGTRFDLNNTSDLLDGGTLNVGDGTNTSKLTVSKGTIGTDSVVNLTNKSTLNVTGGDVTLDSDDTVDGKLNISSGSLALVGITKQNTTTFTQSGGSTTVTGKTFDLNNENDTISGGDLTIGNGINASTMSVSQGAISKNTSVDIAKNSTLNVSGGMVSLGSSTTWSGNVNVTNGKLTLDTADKNFDGVFNQSGGTTIVTGTGFDLDNSADIVSGGILHVGDKTTVSDMSISQGYIDSAAIVNVNRKGTLNVTGGDVVLDSNDAWQGAVNITDGSLALVGIHKTAEAVYTQTGGTSTVTGSTLVFNNTNDKVSNGTLNIGDGGQASSLKVAQGSIEKDTTLNVTSNAKLDISGGKVTIDNGDSWSGDVSLSGGNLLIDDFSNKHGILTQTDGSITVTGSGFDVNHANDKLSGGILNVGDGTTKSDMKISQGLIDYNTRVNIMTNAELNVTGGTVNLSNAYKANDGVLSQSDGTITITGNNLQLNNINDEIAGGTFNIGNGSTVTELSMSNGTINAEANTNINTNAKLNITGGNVNLDSSDTWKGDVNVSSGSLALVGITKNQSGMLNQTGGIVNITGDTFDLNNSADKITGGTFNIGAAGDNSVASVSKGTIAETASTNIALDSSLNINGGNVTLDGATDNFDGNVNLTSGNLILNSMDKNTSGVLTQTNGTTTVVGNGTKLNNENDTIAGGKLNIGNGTITGGLEVERGTILSDASVSIKSGSTLNIAGGKATLDGSNDNWSGEVKVSDGTLDLSGVNKTTTTTAKFNQTGGVTNLDNSKLILGDANSKISGGTVNILQTGELQVNNSSANSSALNSTGGKFSIGSNSQFTTTDGTIDEASQVTVASGSTLTVGGENALVTLDGANDSLVGHLALNSGTLNLKNGVKKTTSSLGTYNQTGGKLNISGSSLNLSDTASQISGGETNIADSGELIIANSNSNSSVLNVAGSNFAVKNGSTFTTTGGVVDSDSVVEVESGSKLAINGKTAEVHLSKNDKTNGHIEVTNGNLYISDDLTKVTHQDGSFVQTSGNTTLTKSSLILADSNSAITGGNLSLKENSTLTFAASSPAYQGGNVIIDDTSVMNYLASKGLVQIDGGNQINIDTSGLINMANNVRTNNSINNLTINNGELGGGVANFAIDINARSNNLSETDTITANSIRVATSGTEGTIRISDYNLGGDIFGYDAPIDRSIRLGKIFQTDDLGKEVTFAATDKEVFTPIGYYRLNPSSANDGSYTFDLARFNPEVYRGQVSSLATYMNQLAFNDTLFNRAHIRHFASNGNQMLKNKSAVLDGNASYERTLRDGQIWTEVYGNLETLKVNGGVGKVRNNAWGFIVGGDFGLRELKNGWSWMPSAYLAYNGGHQTYDSVKMYQNGAQTGFMGTFMKDKAMHSALAYVGVYGANIDVAGFSEDAFNYFAGIATKSSYDWQVGSHFRIQPNLTLAYNMFGQQNWHSNFGQMGMSSGFLNGFNVAPGVNFVIDHENWSTYATVAYAWNFMPNLGGSAGYVSLDDIEMKNGYLQYGFGFTKSFSDKFNMYGQATIRNIGRMGVIFQGGMNWRL